MCMNRRGREWVKGMVVNRASFDFVLLPKRMLGRLLDVKVWRGKMGGVSDHYFGESSAEIGGWM